MPRLRRLLTAALVAVALATGTSACSTPADEIAVTESTIVLDVRTAEEYASGHLEGALNIDVQGADFDALVGELPTDADVVVYCRSGNRSAAAIDRMEQLGFTSLVNAGGLDAAASATGLEIVR
ncbi:rhodanese-like domain-containing protein [Microcella alkalica]|uniref:rhodanese-like domain-containing protein n=1 Tax=Microcella alkalica TaxID=355930 RepID=UPI001CB6F050|nr:rhodanese-like domain-containing protein [Microcella alkalica]